MLTQGKGTAVTEYAEESTVSWYDITIAGRQFNIASRRGEAHIRDVERRIGETITELQNRSEKSNSMNLAFLTALNLADQLVSLEAEISLAPYQRDRQLKTILGRLETVIPDEPGAQEPPNREDTAAVFD